MRVTTPYEHSHLGHTILHLFVKIIKHAFTVFCMNILNAAHMQSETLGEIEKMFISYTVHLY